jgi:putative transposase
MRFALIDRAKAEFPIHRLCGVLGVIQSGYFARPGRPARCRQRDDMVLLAHVFYGFGASYARVCVTWQMDRVFGMFP